MTVGGDITCGNTKGTGRKEMGVDLMKAHYIVKHTDGSF